MPDDDDTLAGSPPVIMSTGHKRGQRDTELIAFALFPLIFLIWSAFAVPAALTLDHRLATSGIPTTAVVTDSTWIKYGPDLATVKFIARGGRAVTTQIEVPENHWNPWSNGTKIAILYWADNPKVARYAAWKATWNALIYAVLPATVFGLLFLGVLVEKYWWRPRRRDRLG